MSNALFDSQGAPIVLGLELGMGGEGTVFDIPARPHQVAKVYNPQHRPDEGKEAKLTFMTESADAQLLQHVAWPQSLLRAGRGGPIVGFLMPKVSGFYPIHSVYSPAHRRQERPKLAWDFLLMVARNLAAAFDTIHAHSHVLGDVNQGNILVSGEGQVALIDSDSFQIDANGTLHMCDVGVAHFVAPELQGLSSYAGVRRTQNQDNFGLAALIFHLLLGGRHPFSGVPLSAAAGQSLESDIKAFRYAYARDNQKRGIAPPPRSIPITLVPKDIEAMFHAAFTEDGVDNRPSAKQWMTALEGLVPKLGHCPVATNHVFPQHLHRCPWCELEQQGVVYFLDLTGYTRAQTGFVLPKVWELIEAVPPPTPIKIPQPEDYPVVARPAPAQKKHKRTIGSMRFLAAAATVAVVVTNPELWLPAGILGVSGAAAAGRIGKEERDTERAGRRTALEQTEKAYQHVVAAMQSEAGIAGFRAKMNELQRLRQEYLTLPRREKIEIDQLHITARERQLKRFLESQFIDNASISGIGPQRKSALRSFDIETAADISQESLGQQITGIGPVNAMALLAWRAECEQHFRFDAKKGVHDTDRNIVRASCAARKVAIEALLRAGVDELQQLRERAAIRMAELQPKAVAAAKLLSQARSDFEEVD